MSVTSLLTTAATNSKITSVAKITEKKENDGIVDYKAASLIMKAKTPSDLQIKLAKQLKKSRQTKAYTTKDLYTGKKDFSSEEHTPLVSIDNSEDEFDYINLKTEAESDDEVVVFKQPRANASKYRFSSTDDCKEHLLRDGFRLDELSDDEDLDLIPPKQEAATWWACEGMTTSCTIQ